MNTLGANRIMFNGKRIGVEVHEGAARIVAIGNTGDLLKALYNMGKTHELVKKQFPNCI